MTGPASAAGTTILAIDSATTRVVVAVGALTGELIDATEWPAGYRHGETLLPTIAALLERLELTPAAVAAIVVGTGPGAFTGLRVGIATAKGMAHALGVPIVGVSTADALLAGAGPDSVLLLPAGPADRLVAEPGLPARLVPAGEDPGVPSGATLVALDLADRAPADALERGETARAGTWRIPARTRCDAPGRRAGRRPGRPRARIRDAAARRHHPKRGGVVVARPPLRLRIEPMRIEDLPEVHAIERASFDAPWPPEAYRNDLETNRLAQYLVARVGDEIAAYGGMWLMVDEGHIITFAVHPEWRRQHIGERLLLAFLDLAADRGAHEATLEVRLSNLPARRLYEKFGFRPVGLRPRYYSDNGEDALIMTTDPLADAATRERIARLRAAVDAAPAPSRPGSEDA